MTVTITLEVTTEPVSTGTGAASQPPSIRQLKLDTGKTVLVTGPNGVGKSSLLAEIAYGITGAGAHAETFFGNRQIQFQSDDIDQIGQSLEQFEFQLRHTVSRFRNPWGEQHLKSVVRRIINIQAQASYEVVRAQEHGATFDEAMAAHTLVIRAINGVFEAARLPIRITMTAGGLRAQRGNAEYSINRMSDGERAALLLVGAALIQPEYSFILIDEPERHLNPAISGALLAALIRTRSDLGFVFASHDLQLLEWLRPEQIIHVRDSFVVRSEPEARRYDMTLLTKDDDIPDELRSAVLGSRRMLLLVEGEASSEDKALYGHIYPDWNVVGRGGWETVVNGVKAIRGHQNYHWLHAAGIIDRDGRDAGERASLAADSVFCLPVPMIENLFLHPVVLEQMASRMHELKGGATGEERVAQLKVEIPKLLMSSRDDIIVKRLVWDANRRNSEHKVSAKSVRDGQTEIARIDLNEIRVRLETEFDTAVSGTDPIAMLSEIPVKNSAIPSRIAKLLGFDDFKDYTRSVLNQVEVGMPAGKAILESLRATMPELPAPGAE